MNKIIAFLLKISILLFFYTSLFAQNYFIDSVNGDNKNDGKSAKTAWKTIKTINDVIKSNDGIFLKRGSVFLGSSIEIDGLTNLRVGAYGKGAKPIISYDIPDGINIITSDAREGLALEIRNSNNIRVSDIEFQGGWASIVLTDSSMVKFLRLDVGKNSQYGIVIEGDDYSNHDITIDSCHIESRFSFPYSYADSKEKRTEDGIIIYSMNNSKITNNFFKNWGHASINLDAYREEAETEISNILISGNYMTSPDIAYGGRIVLDDAHDSMIKNNNIVNTSVASQLGGYNNKYINNLFLNTRTPFKVKDSDGEILEANNTAVLIEAYSGKDVSDNMYLRNRIINSEGVGLKISDKGGLEIKNNSFEYNTISGCGNGEEANNISIEVEPNSEGASFSNSFKRNKINNIAQDTILYRGEKMDVNKFNRQTSHDDLIKNNTWFQL